MANNSATLSELNPIREKATQVFTNIIDILRAYKHAKISIVKAEIEKLIARTYKDFKTQKDKEKFRREISRLTHSDKLKHNKKLKSLNLPSGLDEYIQKELFTIIDEFDPNENNGSLYKLTVNPASRRTELAMLFRARKKIQDNYILIYKQARQIETSFSKNIPSRAEFIFELERSNDPVDKETLNSVLRNQEELEVIDEKILGLFPTLSTYVALYVGLDSYPALLQIPAIVISTMVAICSFIAAIALYIPNLILSATSTLIERLLINPISGESYADILEKHNNNRYPDIEKEFVETSISAIGIEAYENAIFELAFEDYCKKHNINPLLWHLNEAAILNAMFDNGNLSKEDIIANILHEKGEYQVKKEIVELELVRNKKNSKTLYQIVRENMYNTGMTAVKVGLETIWYNITNPCLGNYENNSSLKNTALIISYPPRVLAIIALVAIDILIQAAKKVHYITFLAVALCLYAANLTLLTVFSLPRLIYQTPGAIRQAWKDRAIHALRAKNFINRNPNALTNIIAATMLAAIAIGLTFASFGVALIPFAVAGVSAFVASLFVTSPFFNKIKHNKANLATTTVALLATAGLVTAIALGGLPLLAGFIPASILSLSAPLQLGVLAASAVAIAAVTNLLVPGTINLVKAIIRGRGNDGADPKAESVGTDVPLNNEGNGNYMPGSAANAAQSSYPASSTTNAGTSSFVPYYRQPAKPQ